MAGGNRAYTLQDVLGQLNQDSQQGQADNGATLQINQLTIADDSVAVTEAVTLATGPTSGNWAGTLVSSASLISSPTLVSGTPTGGFKWGTTLWS